MSTRGYLFGNKFDAGEGQGGGQYFQIGRVKDIVLGPFKGGTKKADPNYTSAADIGKIYYELLYSPLGISFSEKVSEPAWPIWSFYKQLPLLNEIVIIIKGPSKGLNDKSISQQSFYFPMYALWGDPNQNAFPNMNEWADYLNKYANQPGYSGTATTGSSLPLGYTFEERPQIKNLRPFEGDTILQSRFGQSIRFGSTVPEQKIENTWSNSGTNGDPITIILNQQKPEAFLEKTLRKFDPIVEDINRDGSAIFMTSTQEIFIEDLNNFPLRSFGKGIDPQRQPVVEFVRPLTVPADFISDKDIDDQILNA
jgi:hypothetical protein